MTKEQILKKAVEKAIKNGWKPFKGIVYEVETTDYHIIFYTRKKYQRVNKGSSMRWGLGMSRNDAIFNHKFAKAFWGEEMTSAIPDTIQVLLGKFKYNGISLRPDWVYHIQQMILEEEPLKYLEKFLN